MDFQIGDLVLKTYPTDYNEACPIKNIKEDENGITYYYVSYEWQTADRIKLVNKK